MNVIKHGFGKDMEKFCVKNSMEQSMHVELDLKLKQILSMISCVQEHLWSLISYVQCALYMSMFNKYCI